MKDEKKDEKKEDKKKDEEEPFTVTWEHEDGSKDTTEAVKLVDKAEGGKAKEGEEKPRLNTFQRIKNRFFGGHNSVASLLSFLPLCSSVF